MKRIAHKLLSLIFRGWACEHARKWRCTRRQPCAWVGGGDQDLLPPVALTSTFHPFPWWFPPLCPISIAKYNTKFFSVYPGSCHLGNLASCPLFSCLPPLLSLAHTLLSIPLTHTLPLICALVTQHWMKENSLLFCRNLFFLFQGHREKSRKAPCWENQGWCNQDLTVLINNI